METFTLSIVHPFSQQTVSIEWLSVASPTGIFVVGPGHQPLISLVLPEKECVYKSSGVEHTIKVSQGGGILHVEKNSVRLILC